MPLPMPSTLAATEAAAGELPPLEGLEQTFAGGIDDRDDQGGWPTWDQERRRDCAQIVAGMAAAAGAACKEGLAWQPAHVSTLPAPPNL